MEKVVTKTKTKIRFVLNFFLGYGCLVFILNGCFLIPKLKVKKALQKKDCQSLSSKYIYELSVREINLSIDSCLEQSRFKEAVSLLDHLEKKDISVKEKQEVIKKRGRIYLNVTKDYIGAAKEFEKFLVGKPNDLQVKKYLIQSYIKMGFLKRALDIIEKLSFKNLKNQEQLEFSFIQARLLLLLGRKEEALSVFQKIKQKNSRFFEKNRGSFYVALILEENHKFLEAIKELQSTNWPFLEEKNVYWKNRDANLPKGS